MTLARVNQGNEVDNLQRYRELNTNNLFSLHMCAKAGLIDQSDFHDFSGFATLHRVMAY